MIEERVQLFFTRPLHVGSEGTSGEGVECSIRSDTLFSAICHGWSQLYRHEATEKLLCQFKQAEAEGTDPPFLISSTFPFIANGDDFIFFLPKPILPPPNPFSTTAQRGREIWEIQKEELQIDDLRFISAPFFGHWIRFTEIQDQGQPETKAICEREKELQARLSQDIRAEEIRPRVQIDRKTGMTHLYAFGSTHFAPRCGLYFFIRWANDKKATLRPKLQSVLRLLGETGIGGERNQGYGLFQPEWGTAAFLPKAETKTNEFLTLSLFHPSDLDWENEFRQDLHQYRLMQRPGWASSPWLKRTYRRKVAVMFEEGAVIKQQVQGGLVDVTPTELKLKEANRHVIYRYGFAFLIPICWS